MPSQMLTTFGSYATAPSRMVCVLMTCSRSEERETRQRLADEVLEVIDRRRHDPTRARVAEHALEAEVARKRGAPACLHREVGHLVGGVQRGDARLEDEERRRRGRRLELAARVREER